MKPKCAHMRAEILQLDDRFDNLVKEYSKLDQTNVHSEVRREDLPNAVLICEICRSLFPFPKEIEESEEIVKLPIHCSKEMIIRIKNV